jgi:hypothetical protein
MQTPSTEDTMIGMQSLDQTDLLDKLNASSDDDAGVLDRCRAMFRNFGERITSFDLGRHLYG